MNSINPSGQVGGTRPGRKPREHINTLYATIKNAFLSRNLDQNMTKMRMFLKRSCKIAAASSIDLRRLWDPLPRLQHCYSCL